MKLLKDKRSLERLLAIVAIVSLIFAWFGGRALTEADIEPYLQQALPTAERFEARGNGVYAAYSEKENPGTVLEGYVAVGEASGYGGPLELAVALNPAGTITGVSVIEHRETTSFFERVLEAEYVEAYLNQGWSIQPPDAITGATYTSQALSGAILEAGRTVAVQELETTVATPPGPPIQFGVPEMLVLALFAVGFVGHRRQFKYKKQVRWATMLVGLIALGFLFNLPFTLARLNGFLLGYWPAWQSNLYWYLLVGGILLVLLVDNKNPYCEWFCPFGAAQECMGAIGGAKTRTSRRYRSLLTWTQRGLAWAAVFVALLFRNPGLTSYEVFGGLFSLTGSPYVFAALAIVLIAALFVRRPWCNFLCPLRPIIDLLRVMRKWTIEKWQQRAGNPA